MIMNINVIIKTITVAIFTGILVSGCTDECEKTPLGYVNNVRFILDAQVHGTSGTELAFKTVEFRTYKEPCGQLPKGHFGWTGITSGTGYASGNVTPYYNVDNEEDLIVTTATLIDGNNPSQTQTQTFRATALAGTGGVMEVDFHFDLGY